MLSSSHSSSKSIPIPISEDDCRHNRYSQLDLEHASKVAEWHESQMYQRLLTGMFISCQRSDYHPKVIRSLENLMQTQALPLSSLEASNPTSDQLNEEWLICSSCRSGGDGDTIDTKRPRVVSPDCFCSGSSTRGRTSSLPSSLPSWNYTLESSSSTLASAAPEALQQQDKSICDEEEDGLIFDFEI